MGLLFKRIFFLHDFYLDLIKQFVETLGLGAAKLFRIFLIKNLFYLLIFRSNFLRVVISQPIQLMVKKVFYSFIILMDEVQVMLLSWLKPNMKHHKLYLNIKKLWVHDILNYFVVQQLKYNRLIESLFFYLFVNIFDRYFVEVKIRKIFKHH